MEKTSGKNMCYSTYIIHFHKKDKENKLIRISCLKYYKFLKEHGNFVSDHTEITLLQMQRKKKHSLFTNKHACMNETDRNFIVGIGRRKKHIEGFSFNSEHTQMLTDLTLFSIYIYYSFSQKQYRE